MNGKGLIPALSVMVACAVLRGAPAIRGRAAAIARLRHDDPLAGAARPRPAEPLVLRSGPSWMATGLAEAGLTLDAGRAWHLWLGSLATAAAAGAMIGGVGGCMVAGGAAAAGPVVGWRILRCRGADRFEAALPGAADAVAGALRSGASLRQALSEAAAATPAPVGPELLAVARAVERGVSVVAALEAWAERRPTAGVRLVVSALCLGAETGGALARAVDGVAATLRQRIAARAEARALATQARASAAVIGAAPLVFTVVSSAADGRTAAFLFRTGPGLACLTAGLALEVVGGLWMARLTRVDLDA